MTSTQSGSSRLADRLPLPDGRIVILAEYPYYRAAATAWKQNLTALRALGADAITAYVPWRLHEIGDVDGTFAYDFDGHSHPQRNLMGFVDLAAEAGLLVMLKPGPYVHGEIRLGGLPDRVGRFPSRLSADGATLTEELVPMPSAHSQEFRDAANQWLQVFRERVLAPKAAPAGPVVALQVGNEGVFSELNLPMDAEDYSESALSPLGLSTADLPSHRTRLAVWSGTRLREVVAEYRDTLKSPVPVVWNMPLPGPGRQTEAWLTRAAAALPDGVMAANTSWSGNAATSDEALSALWLGMRLHHTDTAEDNWGFTWTDESYARPATPLYNAMLGLAFGSSTISVYTACTTHHWAPGIGPDDAGLRAEGKDPATFAPPYCPGAPLDESGSQQPNAAALRLLRRFTDWSGTVLRSALPRPNAWLVADPATVAESAWPMSAETEPTPTRVAVAAAVRWMSAQDIEIDPAARVPIEDGPLLVIGGRSMAAATQHAIAEAIRAGRTCVLVGPIPLRDESGEPCEVLAEALKSDSGRTRVVPVTADVDTSVRQVLAAVGGADSGDTGPLILRRRHEDGEVTWLFNRFDRAIDVGLESGVALRLAPRGAAALVSEAGVLRTFLIHTGPDPDAEPARLSTGAGEPPHRFAEHTVGRRTESGWQLWSGRTD